MLGEDHSLINEFKKHENRIHELIKNDQNFAKDVQKYNSLDKEIRELELRSVPISDEAMHLLKHDRAVLKDSLYKKIIS